MLNNSDYINMYLENLRDLEEKKNNTIVSYYYDLKNFHLWNLQDANLSWTSMTTNDINRYLGTRYDEGLGVNAINRLISTLRSFFSYLVVNDYINHNPMHKVVTPKKIATPCIYLSPEQMQKLLSRPQLDTKIGMRDRAMLEILYSSGLRISELVNLTFDQIDFERGLLKIYGKGGKTRIIPIAYYALVYLNNYLTQYRYQLNTLSDYVFTNSKGRPMTRTNFWLRIKDYAKVLGIDLTGFGPHSIRHTFATHMLNGGADIRSVQTLLGHSSLMTTQVYTHIANEQLKQLHQDHQLREEVNYQQLLANCNQQYLQFQLQDQVKK